MAFRGIRLGHEWHPIARALQPPSLPAFHQGIRVPAKTGPVADCARWAIVTPANRHLENQCVSRPSPSSSNVNRPVSPSPTLQNRRSGEGWTLTSHKVSKINEMATSGIWTTRPPSVATTAPNPQAAACTAVSGCRECRKLTARCAWAAAWKMARLSLASTDSHDCR